MGFGGRHARGVWPCRAEEREGVRLTSEEREGPSIYRLSGRGAIEVSVPVKPSIYDAFVIQI